MTTKKPKKTELQKQSEREALKAFRHNVAVLKKAGIISKKVDARSLAPTPHYKKIIRDYADVITGKVKAVKVPRACPITGCKTVKKNNKTIALVNVEGMYKPRVTVRKSGISIVDRFFGTSELSVMINRKSTDLLNLDENEIDLLAAKYSIGDNQAFVFTIEDKKHGKSYISKLSFTSLDKLLEYMELYTHGSHGADFNNAVVSIRIMGDADISAYQNKQAAETLKNKRARQAAYKKAKRAKEKSTRNII
jgi:hypothetical protein